MNKMHEIPTLLSTIPLDGILRIDAALEGDWSPTVVTIWSRHEGFVGFAQVVRSHPTYKPSLELYFDGAWLGMHCFNRVNGENIFDDLLATRLVKYVDADLASPRG